MDENNNVSVICYLFDVLSASPIPIEKKRETLFKKIIVAFRSQDPLTNFLNSDEGPLINITKLTQSGDLTGMVENENGVMEGDIQEFRIRKTYCPICGGTLNHSFSIDDFYCNDISESKFFNKKVIYSNNPNNYFKQTSFNYIDCPKCLKNISINFDKFGKPLKNDYLYDLYFRIGKYLGLELDDDMNKRYQSRCLFPVDRMYFKLKDRVFYFNLFNLTGYTRDKFKYYFQEVLNYNEEKIDEAKLIVLTKLSENVFDPDSCLVYRDFEEFLLKEAKKDFLSKEFFDIEMKQFDYEFIEKIDNQYKVKCLNNCEKCDKIILFPDEREMMGCILLRKDYKTCEAKKYLFKEKESENMSILTPEEEGNLSKEDVNLEPEEPQNIDNKISTTEHLENSIDDGFESLPGEIEENPIGVMIDEKEETKMDEPIQESFNEFENKTKEAINEVIPSEPSQIENKLDVSSIQDNNEISETQAEVSEVETNEEEKENNNVQIETNSQEEFSNSENDMERSDNSKIEESVNKNHTKHEIISEEYVDYGSFKPFDTLTIHNVEKDKKESEENIIEQFDEREKEDKNILEQMTLEMENVNYIKSETEFKNKDLNVKQRVMEAIMSVDDPQPEEFVSTYQSWISSMEPEQKKKFDSVEINVKMMKGMELWFQYRAQDIQNEVEMSGKSYLNKYPLLSYEDLRDYLFDILINESKQSYSEQEERKSSKESKPYVTSDPYDHKQDYDPEDSFNKSNKFKQDILEKNEARYQKNKDKCNVKTLFRVQSIKQNNPFVLRESLKDRYENSVFKIVFELVKKIDGYKAGAPIVTIDKNSLLTPVVDFPEVGVRFLCIDTTDTKYFTFQEPPMKLINRIPFPNEKFKNNHSINFLYSNECVTKPKQVAHSIFKIVNRNFYPDDLIVRLNGRNYPLAYSIEKQALLAMEEDYSIFSGLGRVKDSQVTIVAFVENEGNTYDDYQVRERMAKNIQNRKFLHNSYSSSFQNLLETNDMLYILSAHYLEDKEWEYVGNREEPYMHYTITQYTENTSCIIEDGLPVVIAAIIKEHYRKYPNMGYCFTYEFDKTALVSPSVRKLIQGTQGIFNIDPTSLNQSITDTVTNWIISESRFQKSSKPVDDRARQDYRYFTAAESTLRAFLGNKIRPDEDLSNVEKVLVSTGYFSYPEPKTYNFEITKYGLELIENSPLFYSMFPIELAKLGQENAFDNYNKAYQDILTAKFMMDSNLNAPGSKELFEVIHHGGKVLTELIETFKK